MARSVQGKRKRATTVVFKRGRKGWIVGRVRGSGGKVKKVPLGDFLRERERGSIHLNLSVEAMATDVHLQRAIRRHGYTSDALDWPRRPLKKFKNGYAYRRGLAYTDNAEKVSATVVIDAYLTNKVPKRLRERTVAIRSEGEALVVAAKMYLKVYQANEKLGGDKAQNPNLKRRVSERRKRSGHEHVLINRGFEPYVWGHDIGDLVFERMYIRWGKRPPAGGRRTCRITFGIGS